MTTLTNNQSEQLFTDLTPEEAAVIAGGGSNFYLYQITCIKAGADKGRFNSDDLYITLGGKKASRPRAMDAGQSLIYKTPYYRSFGKKGLTLRLWDEDVRYDDPVGRLHVKERTGGKKTTRKGGSGSVYELIYKVT